MRPILYVVFGIGVIGLLSTFILTLDAKGFAEYWVKEEMRVIKNPGDGDYYLDLGENYYKMHHFYDSDFKKLKNDSCVVYRPGRTSILWGAVYQSPNMNPDEWQIRFDDDIIYEKLVQKNPERVELKESQK
ncbi:MAG: hypothetical protein P8J32_01280 [bacterium]|nr:hypothetical protein [bacterium]